MRRRRRSCGTDEVDPIVVVVDSTSVPVVGGPAAGASWPVPRANTN